MAGDLKPPAADLLCPVYGLIPRDIAARLLGQTAAALAQVVAVGDDVQGADHRLRAGLAERLSRGLARRGALLLARLRSSGFHRRQRGDAAPLPKRRRPSAGIATSGNVAASTNASQHCVRSSHLMASHRGLDMSGWPSATLPPHDAQEGRQGWDGDAVERRDRPRRRERSAQAHGVERPRGKPSLADIRARCPGRNFPYSSMPPDNADGTIYPLPK
jgi:hypothetical protein